MPSDRITFSSPQYIIGTPEYARAVEDWSLSLLGHKPQAEEKPVQHPLKQGAEREKFGTEFKEKFGFSYGSISRRNTSMAFPHNQYKVALWPWGDSSDLLYVGKLSTSIMGALAASSYQGYYVGLSLFDMGGTFLIARFIPDKEKLVVDWTYDVRYKNDAVYEAHLKLQDTKSLMEKALGFKG